MPEQNKTAMATVTADLAVAAYNILFIFFVVVCMTFRIFPRHLGFPEGDLGYLILMALWFIGMIFVYAAVFHCVLSTFAKGR